MIKNDLSFDILRHFLRNELTKLNDQLADGLIIQLLERCSELAKTCARKPGQCQSDGVKNTTFWFGIY